MPATPPWLATAEAMFNRSIDASSQAAELARRLDSTSLQVDVDDLIRVRAAMHHGRLALSTVGDTECAAVAADAAISGSIPALLSMLKGARPTEARAASRGSAGRGPAGRGLAVTISGDAEIANGYRQLFIAARPDPEEELSRWIGDAPARSLSRIANGFIGWARRTQRVVGENVAEYLQEESRDLVARAELEEFLQGVDQVRETADRVEARLHSLQQRLRNDV